MFKAPSRFNKRIQRTMFNNLLNASMERTNETVLNKILNLFMDSHISGWSYLYHKIDNLLKRSHCHANLIQIKYIYNIFLFFKYHF